MTISFQYPTLNLGSAYLIMKKIILSVGLAGILLGLVLVYPQRDAQSQTPTVSSTQTDSNKAQYDQKRPLIVKFKKGRSKRALEQAVTGASRSTLSQLKKRLFGPSNEEQLLTNIRSLENRYALQTKPISHGHEDLVVAERLNTQPLDIAQAVAAFKSLPNVEYAEPNYLLTIQIAPNDPYYQDSYPTNTVNRDPSWNPAFDYQWNLKNIKSEGGWNLTTRNSNIVAAVIDTGIDYTHPEFGSCTLNQVRNNQCSKIAPGYNFIDLNDNPMDDNYHGTFVAGIIAAFTNNNQGIAGVNWNVKIMPVKVCTNTGYCDSASVVNGIMYAADHNAQVINLSLGTNSPTQTLQDAIKYAYLKNIVIVASAGNQNVSTTMMYPAAYNEVITVGASDELDNKVAFSNFGYKLDVVAPGGGSDCTMSGRPNFCNNILSLKSSQSNRDTNLNVGASYTRSSGTSFSSPHVVGLATLILSLRPNSTNEEVRNIIRNGADDIYLPGFDEWTGYGRINVAKTLNQLNAASRGEALITSPRHLELVGQQFTLSGTARGNGFHRYQLSYAPSPNGPWNTDGVNLTTPNGAQSVNNSTLATINLPPAYPRGEVYVKLEVETDNGAQSAMSQLGYYQKPGSVWPAFQEGDRNPTRNRYPLLVDINGDGKKEIIFVDQDSKKVRVYDHLAHLLWEKDYDGSIISAGKIEDGTPGLQLIGQSSTRMIAWRGDGSEIQNFNIPEQPSSSNIVVDDLDQDGKDEIVYISGNNLSVLSKNASNQYSIKWEKSISAGGGDFPIIMKISADGKKGIVTFANNSHDLKVYDYSGNLLATTTRQGSYYFTKIVSLDVDADGVDELVYYERWAGLSAIKLQNNSTTHLWGPFDPQSDASYLGSFDLDHDGKPEIFFQDSSRGQFVINGDGSIRLPKQGDLFASPLYSSYQGYKDTAKFSLLDIDNTPNLVEIGERYQDEYEYLELIPFKNDSTTKFLLDSFRKIPFSRTFADPKYLAVADLDGNGKPDIVINRTGILELPFTTGKVYWPQYLHDERHTGSYSSVIPAFTPTPTPTACPSCIEYLHSIPYREPGGRYTVILSWNNVDNEEGYEIYRGSSLLIRLSANTTTYTDSSVVCGTTYTYDVRPVRASCTTHACTALPVTTTACPIPTNTPIPITFHIQPGTGQRGTVTVAPTPLPPQLCPAQCSYTARLGRAAGDADCNGKIELNDFAIWLTQYQVYSDNKTISGPERIADFNCSQQQQGVTREDYEIWLNSYRSLSK